MNITPIEFIQSLKNGRTEKEMNLKEVIVFDQQKIEELIKYGHDAKSAKEYLSTDYSNGFTVCSSCGSFYHLGNGFTKHMSKGCLHCEGKERHQVYFVNASKQSEGGFPARYMSIMFDDGMSYCKDKLQIKKYYNLIIEQKQIL